MLQGVAAVVGARALPGKHQGSRQGPAGLLRRRAVQLRRVGTQMYAVQGGGKALRRQATPAKPVGRTSQPRSLLKRVGRPAPPIALLFGTYSWSCYSSIRLDMVA